MSAYMTEEEQLENIKQWWKKYGSLITTTLAILLVAWTGYKYWVRHEESVLSEASKIYESLMYAASKEDDKSLRAFATQLVQEYPKTVYSDVARLSLAKFYVEKGQHAKAKSFLEKVSSSTGRPIFQELAKVRIARILVAEKAYDQALTTLKAVSGSPLNPAIHELEGDIYAALNKPEQALSSYRATLGEIQTLGINNNFLEMKMNDLAVRVAGQF